MKMLRRCRQRVRKVRSHTLSMEIGSSDSVREKIRRDAETHTPMVAPRMIRLSGQGNAELGVQHIAPVPVGDSEVGAVVI